MIISYYAELSVSVNTYTVKNAFDRLLFTIATIQGNTLAIAWVCMCVVICLKIMCVILC